VGGYFTTLGGQSRNNIGRLNADGTLDPTFNPGANDEVISLAVQEDGKILVGGFFITLGGQSRIGIGRLNADGTLDSGFNPGSGGTFPYVDSLALQADGRILVGGFFTTLGGQTRNRIARLNADGTLDAGFNPGANGGVLSLALQADGKIVVGGFFTTLGGQSRNYIVRLNTDGTLDSGFNPGIDGQVYSLALQADGKIVVGGDFFTLGRQDRNYFGRLNNSGPATQSLTFDGSTLTWMRGGTSPEVWRTTFEYAPDGASWTNLGGGIRIPGGWQLNGLALPTNTAFRARGCTVGGTDDSSGWFVETFIGPLVINEQPASLTNNAGTTATFTVYAVGSGPLSYQWRKDGRNLADGGNMFGAATTSLSLGNVRRGDAGGYSVFITNAAGSVTSAVATLTVIDPAINAQPASQLKNAGDSVILSVAAAGTPLLNYQWWKDGGLLAGATQSSLTLTNLQTSNTGSYYLVVSNEWGSVTSAVALVSVNLALPDSFNPGAYYSVYSLALQADGKILVGGGITTLAGLSRTNIGRLNADGTLDASFNPGADGGVLALAVQADGKILVGGQFTTLGGQSRICIGRLNADGTLDTNFNPGGGYYVRSLAVQADGKTLVGGDFSTLGGQSRFAIGRLNADGTLDTSFNAGTGGRVKSLAVQADGKILVAGEFRTLNGQSGSGMGRLNADGTLDVNFSPGTDDAGKSLALQADGKILLGGAFTTLGGQSRTNIGRLNNARPATQSLAFDGSTLTWMRGGTSPEVWRSTFDYSPDGGNSWTGLGAGIRIPGGWQLVGLALPKYTAFRARGYTGDGASSSWFVETVLRQPLAISDILYSANGQFGFSAGGPAGQVVVIEASTDLRTWRPLQTNTLGAASVSFTDLKAALFPTRFYRLRSVP
jgi:uncharacterized delta-60 repeat protein